MLKLSLIQAAAAAFILSAGCTAAAAGENGVTPTTILIGQSGEFSGQGVARENTDGARAYFGHVNRHGGVNGRKIELRSYDDGRVVQRTVANTEKLIREDKVFALFGYRSTPSVAAALPILTQARVPLVAPFSGAQAIREPLSPLVFHLRASYQQEAGALIMQLATQGIHRIGVMVQDDEFGRDAQAGFERHMKERQLAPTFVARYDRKTLDVSGAVDALARTTPEAVVMACTPKACVDFVKAVHARGLKPQFFTLSNVNSDEFAKALGDDGRGIGVTQVVPHPWRAGVPLVREFHQVLQQMPAAAAPPVSYSSFEGFVAAKLLVEGLKRAGANPTRESFATAMESLHELDLGGMTVRFSATDHTGSDYVELTMISRDGKYIR